METKSQMDSVRSFASSGTREWSAADMARSALAVIAFAALTALAGQVRVPLPFTPVPATLQLIPVLLAGAALGPMRGAASQLALMAAGSMGLPVFTGGGAGPYHLLGATGGYLIGFVGAAWLVGRLVHGPVRLGAAGVLVSMVAASLLIHLFGVLHLSIYLGGSLGGALQLGSMPFLVADILKAVVATAVFLAWPRGRKSER
jgi:biotin transport system substrate-specific component